MAMPVSNRRVVEMEGCFNFRDLGGYPAGDGRTVKWQRLFRADGLHRLTETDLNQLAELGLATVIDLRTGQELEEVGRISWAAPDLAYHHLPMLDVLPDRTTYPAWVDASYVADRYVGMLEKGADAMAEALVLLADPAAYPAVFHCSAGKDRTGLLAALVLGLLGVSDGNIISDYALSQQAMGRMLTWLRAERPEIRDQIEDSAAAIVAAEPDTMALFIERLRQRHGSFIGYAESLGVGATIASIQQALLDDSPLSR
jgi:protein-tyrosine phosphatase